MKNLGLKIAQIGVLSMGLLAGQALAQTGASGVFTMHNDTTDYVVAGFYTNDGTGWSANWLAENLGPGETAEAQFAATTGACEQTFQVGWLTADGGEVLDDPININICEASHVYLADNEIYFE